MKRAVCEPKKYLIEANLPHMWCSGCGNGIVLHALSRAFAELRLEKEKTVIVTGIGCWGKADDYIDTHTLHGTHGRAIPFAMGIKAGNPELKVIALMGDGDGSSIGGNHLIHAARRNIEITAVIVNNFNYGMTGGQYSATTPVDKKTSTSILGNVEDALDLCALVGAAGAGFVGRSTVYHVNHLKNLLVEALQKEKFAFVEVLSTCPTYYGRNNVGNAVEMLNWLKEKSVNNKLYTGLTPAAKEGLFPIGKFIDKDVPGFLARYKEKQKSAKKRELPDGS